MKYSIDKEEINSFYNSMYAGNVNSVAFSSSKDIIDADVLNMHINEWKISGIKAQSIKTRTKKDMDISGGLYGKFLVLHFVCEGETRLGNNSVMMKNTNGLFISGNPIEHIFKRKQTDDYFKIILPCDYLNCGAAQCPNVFGRLSKMLENHSLEKEKEPLITTLEMKTVINQIKNSTCMGNLAPFYFETKVKELLVLQMSQIDKTFDPKEKCCRHYYKQLNQARNIIEQFYQSPLTITEIARQVGMSETVLKTDFKAYFGTTIYGYLFNYRMEMAKKLLSDFSMTIAEIGYKSGYEYPSHFTTAFKRRYGLSPIDYRNKYA
ncbi:MAG: AraC family transcriptional regulator [Bacteroidales bacterium]|jgi:AraC-like DNA-binding protein|nr:AraC family transcriptional regulator [Bacteroidales bacterium]